ncbi:MAG: hypothetical protein LUQ16_08535 [Methanomassiliicoccales archaeon]|jgi:hypothetical protein|nr:hypothetical protein [Methanomassiliicoccales archaeon]MDD1756067.1 hypothetical protein [Methanomassiliicoccales archaeon]
MAETAFPRKAKLFISLLLIVAAFAMYWGWGLMYGTWNIVARESMGVYAIVITLLAFGILGLLLSLKQK